MFNVSKKKAIRFFEENYIMIHSMQTKSEEGCADKCLEILKKSERICIPIPVIGETIDGDKYHEQDEVYEEVYHCLNCGAKIFMNNYCSNCGVRLGDG